MDETYSSHQLHQSHQSHQSQWTFGYDRDLYNSDTYRLGLHNLDDDDSSYDVNDDDADDNTIENTESNTPVSIINPSDSIIELITVDVTPRRPHIPYAVIRVKQYNDNSVYYFNIYDLVEDKGSLYTPGSNILKCIADGTIWRHPEYPCYRDNNVWVIGSFKDPLFLHYIYNKFCNHKISYDYKKINDIRNTFAKYGLHFMVTDLDYFESNAKLKWCSAL